MAIQSSKNNCRSKSLASARNGIHIARPWLKSKDTASSSPSLNGESSEDDEEMDQTCGAIQSVLLAHQRRRSALNRLARRQEEIDTGKADTSGSILISDIRDTKAGRAERSDGITDDDEDVVY